MADSQFYRPGLPQLISMIRSDLLTRFEQDTLLRRMDAEVYARVSDALAVPECRTGHVWCGG